MATWPIVISAQAATEQRKIDLDGSQALVVVAVEEEVNKERCDLGR